MTARWALGRKNSLSFEQIYYWCLFLYAVIKASLLPNINFTTLFVQTPIHFLSPYGLNGFIFLCRKEMPYYIRHEFIAGLQFSFLKDLFQEAMLVKNEFGFTAGQDY